MKRLAILLIVITTAFIAGSCTRTAAVPSAERMETMVAATLTAAPTSPPTATLPPSATPILTPSSTPTSTPTAGPSPTPLPPDLPPDDPRYGIDLSKPQYLDNMGSQSTWFGPNFEGAMNVWEEERHRASDYWTDQSIWWSTTIREIDAGNVYVEITAELGDCTGKDGYGIAVRVNGDMRNSGYTIEFACDGSYQFRKFTSGAVQNLLEWTSSDLIRTGPNTTNRIGFLASGNTLYGFANGEYLSQVEDFSFIYGTYGLFASAVETTGVTVYFDDFKLWFLSP